MNWKVIEKNKIAVLIRELAKETKVFMPVKENNMVSFQKVMGGIEAGTDWNVQISQLDTPAFWNTKKPPKEVFLPQTETLFTYRRDKEALELVESPPTKEKRLFFRVRPCDARSFALLDKFLTSDEYKDSYYLDKRKNTTIIGLACNNPRSTCFCTSVGGSPFGKEGIDLLLQDVGDKYLIEPVTEKGRKLIESLPWLEDAEKTDLEKARKLSEKAETTLMPKVAVDGVSEKLDKMFDDSLWSEIFQKCLGCGVCTFLCPTCCCFDVLDEEGLRARIWDSCQFPSFTLHGSGHNPRPSGKERMRQRIMHKFNYFVKNYGENFCVGCGRCIQECPVNLDIREVIEKIAARPVG